ncbi:hypothetical protein IFM89_014599 [Coptis chinensis]|uniref:RING-type domain-containing protein n=1 Tax=Coptis chinensis TaxID=261450 RepID=A0A835HD84_9MAGN|nr:hypothetical protein IFM89_014599 [Coptis chinensis]
MTNEGGRTCPVCTEEMDLTDQQLKPCKCGYEICVWCWHHIMDMAEKDGTEGRCPACRTPYDKEKIVSMAASCERLVAEINSERKQKPHKGKSRTFEGRKHLSNVRVIQRHLVYTMGLPANLADEDLLQHKEYFGQYGKVLKASLTRTSGGAVQYSTDNTCSVACFGTTKYCHTWLRNMPCSNHNCVYLHDIGTEEDSFLKDETVSAYTRNRVQQITGATSNMENRSGDVLPPPLDEFCVSSTALSKPISRSSSYNASTQLNGSPPNSGSGKSASLPPAASWGLRVSNGHTPTATLTCSNSPSKQYHEDCNGSVGFPLLVSRKTSASLLHSDVGKKCWISKDGSANHLNKDIESSEISKTVAVKDRPKIMQDTPREARDVALSGDNAGHLPCLATSKDDDCIQKLQNSSFSLESGRQSWLAFPDKDSNAVVDGTVQTLRSGLPVTSDSCHSSEHSDATENYSSFSNELYIPSRNSLQQSYPDPVPSDVFIPKELSYWGSESQADSLRDTFAAPDNSYLAFGEQSSNFSEICDPLHIPHTSNSTKFSSCSNGDSWSSCGTSDLVGKDPQPVLAKADEATYSSTVLSNGYEENNVTTSTARLENIFEHSNLFSVVEKGKYVGGFGNNTVSFEKNISVDTGESNIISNILSIDIDAWDESLGSHHNFAKLLSETDKEFGWFKTRSSPKEQRSNQSRFSFARQGDFADEGTGSKLSTCNAGHTMNKFAAPQESQVNQNIHLHDLRNGLSSKFFEESDGPYNGSSNISSNRHSVSRPQASAPPGFSYPSKTPPPGFSVRERMDNAFDATTVNHYLGNSSMLGSQWHVQPTTNAAAEDFELIDPAILAVGAGRPQNGVNNLCLDMISSSLPLGASEMDPRIQLVRQQFLSPQQSPGYSDHVRDRLLPLTEPFCTSRFLDQSQFAQLSLQSRNEHIPHGGDRWNENQSVNNLAMEERSTNERFGFGQYYPEYDDRNSRIPKPNRLYNQGFRM